MREQGKRSPGSLSVVGTGIMYLVHVTHETPAYIEQADIVIHGVTDPATKEWIERLNPHAESVCDYVRAVQRPALITDTEHLAEALHGREGTWIVP